jgi:hypothetical protein
MRNYQKTDPSACLLGAARGNAHTQYEPGSYPRIADSAVVLKAGEALLWNQNEIDASQGVAAEQLTFLVNTIKRHHDLHVREGPPLDTTRNVSEAHSFCLHHSEPKLAQSANASNKLGVSRPVEGNAERLLTLLQQESLLMFIFMYTGQCTCFQRIRFVYACMYKYAMFLLLTCFTCC